MSGEGFSRNEILMRRVRFFLPILLAFWVLPASPCSRVLWQEGDFDVIIGRSLDWVEEPRSNLWLFPRGLSHDGLVSGYSLKWTSKYGSIGFSIYDGGIIEGMNEEGLNASLLYLTESDYGKRDKKQPGLSISLWAQYFLDNYSSVKEAIRDIEENPFQVVMVNLGDQDQYKGTGHLAISDKYGDSAVIEYIEGKRFIYHDKNHRVMTNSPTFEEQLKNLERYDGFGGTEKLPGTTQAADRFVRAAYYLKNLPVPKSEREAIAGVFSVIRNVSQPFGELDPEHPHISPTRWRVAADLNKGIYYYESSLSPNIVWIDMSKLDFQKGRSVAKIDLAEDLDKVGDISGYFRPTEMMEIIEPDIELE